MGDKTTRLRRLMMDGYRMESVESDNDSIEATLRRGGEVVILRFRREDAAELLLLPRA